MAIPAILVKDLCKTYANGTRALKGVTFTVAEKDFFALLGRNGAGKTTAIGIITGLIQKTAGEVRIFGTSIDDDPKLAKTYLGIVPQEFNFNIFEKVLDIVVNQAGYYGISRRQALAAAEPILTDLGLWEKCYDASQTLSGGMKRRLMIARALIHNPRILILDEPTAGVDVELRRSMWKFLRQRNDKGLTIVLTTHYLEEAEQLSKNIAIIDRGEIVANEPTKDFIRRHGDKKLEDIFLQLIESPRKS